MTWAELLLAWFGLNGAPRLLWQTALRSKPKPPPVLFRLTFPA